MEQLLYNLAIVLVRCFAFFLPLQASVQKKHATLVNVSNIGFVVGVSSVANYITNIEAFHDAQSSYCMHHNI